MSTILLGGETTDGYSAIPAQPNALATLNNEFERLHDHRQNAKVTQVR
jgi:hypothetical protein